MKRNSQSGNGRQNKGAGKDTLTKGLEAVSDTLGRFTTKTFPESEMPNAVEMLKDDHEKVKQLFEDFEGAEDTRTKTQIVETALRELTVHAALEEEIFYPAVRKADDEEEHEEKMDEALEEHHAAKMLIAELENMTAKDERYDAKFKVLSEMVRHHIEEEENEILPKAEGLELEELGQQMAMRKRALLTGSALKSGRHPGRKPAKAQAQRSRASLPRRRTIGRRR